MQTEKSEPEGQRIMSERGLPSFRRYPLTRGFGLSVCIGDRCLIIFLTYDIKKIIYRSSFLLVLTFTSHNDLFRTSFGVFHGGAKVTSFNEFSSTANIEETVSHW